MFQVFAMSSVCSPMLRPVTRFFTSGTKRSDVGWTQLAKQPDTLGRTARLKHATKPIRQILPEPDLNAAHALVSNLQNLVQPKDPDLQNAWGVANMPVVDSE